MISHAPAGADIFAASADVLVNPVNTHGKMGKGLALVFKQRFPELDRDYREICAAGALEPGGLYIWKNPNGSPKFIANIATKDSPWQPSQYQWVQSGLESLREWAEGADVTTIASPALGAGLGGLDETRVKEIVDRVFTDSPVTLQWHGKLERTAQAEKSSPAIVAVGARFSDADRDQLARSTARGNFRETTTHVYFWGGPLSQWYKSSFDAKLVSESQNRTFNCAEQYMMASKADLFGDTEALERIMESSNPHEQKAIGKTVRRFDVDVWEKAVPDILVTGNTAKFGQNDALREYLHSTSGKRLVEGSPYDVIYGVGLRFDDPKIENEANWRGRNLLGQTLEVTREKLQRGVAPIVVEYLPPGAPRPAGIEDGGALGPTARSGTVLYEGKAYNPAHAYFFLPHETVRSYQADVEKTMGPLDHWRSMAAANALALGKTPDEAVPFIEKMRATWEKFADRMPGVSEHDMHGFTSDDYQAVEDGLGRPLSDLDMAEIAIQARKGLEPEQVVTVLQEFDRLSPAAAVPVKLRIANASHLQAEKSEKGFVAGLSDMGYVGRSRWVPEKLGMTWYAALGNQNKVESFGGKVEPAVRAFESDLVDALKDRRTNSKAMQEDLAEIVSHAEKSKAFTFVCHCAPGPCHCNVLLTYVAVTLKKRGNDLDVLDVDRDRAVGYTDLRKLLRQEAVNERSASRG